MNKKIYSAIILLLTFLPLIGQENGFESINKGDLQKHLKIISSPAFEGRRAGQPGCEKAAMYISEIIASYGLKHAPGIVNYKQEFDIYYRNIEKKGTYLKLKDATGEEVLLPDIAVLAPVKSDTVVNNQVVFIGHGHVDDETGYDDLEGLDLMGKTVLMMAGKPNQELTEPYYSIGFDPEFEGLKVGRLYERGATTILFFSPPSITDRVDYDIEKLSMLSSEEMGVSELETELVPFQFFAISQEDADRILSAASKPNTEEIENKILKTGKPNSFPLENIELSIHLDITSGKLKDRNVIGIVEGSDPKLKDEYIVYCAHYDHDGVGEDGEVYYGADDNGSGSAGLLELAQAYGSLMEKPKRSIVFIWFAAEERGLLGSKYYSEHPVVPFEQTVACINLDMIGRTKLESDTTPSLGFGFISVTGGDSIHVIHAGTSKQLVKINEKNCKDLVLTPLYNQAEFINYSDQFYFHAHGVPVIFLHTGLHSDYHTPRDTEDRIDYSIMLKATQLAYKTGFKVADKKGRIKKTKPKDFTRY